MQESEEDLEIKRKIEKFITEKLEIVVIEHEKTLELKNKHYEFKRKINDYNFDWHLKLIVLIAGYMFVLGCASFFGYQSYEYIREKKNVVSTVR